MFYKRGDFLGGRLALVGLGRAHNVMDAVYASDSWRILGFTAARIAKQLKVVIYEHCLSLPFLFLFCCK